MTAITQLSAVTIPLIGDELLTFVDTSAPAGQKNKKGTLSSVKDYVLSGVTSGSSIITSSVTINVPADYPDLKDAIDAYLDKYCAAGAVVNCVIASGHTVTQQCWYQDIDMPWFIISGENGVVDVNTSGWGESPLTGEMALFSLVSSRGPDIRCLFNDTVGTPNASVFDLVGSVIECLGTTGPVGATGWDKIGEIQLQSSLSALTWQSDGGNLVAKSDSDVNLQMYGGSQIVLGDVECWSGSYINLQDNSSAAPSISLRTAVARGGTITISDVTPQDNGGSYTVFECNDSGSITITGDIGRLTGVTIGSMFSAENGGAINFRSIDIDWFTDGTQICNRPLNTIAGTGMVVGGEDGTESAGDFVFTPSSGDTVIIPSWARTVAIDIVGTLAALTVDASSVSAELGTSVQVTFGGAVTALSWTGVSLTSLTTVPAGYVAVIQSTALGLAAK